MKFNFSELRRSVQYNLDLSIQEPLPDVHSDTEFSHSSKKMDIIGETPKRYATIDHSKFETMPTPSDSFESEDEILELDRIPCYAKSI